MSACSRSLAAGGALIAPLAGRGLSRPVTRRRVHRGSLAFTAAGLGRHNVIVLCVAGVATDMAAQADFVFGQHVIYWLDAGARSRLNSACIATAPGAALAPRAVILDSITGLLACL